MVIIYDGAFKKIYNMLVHHLLFHLLLSHLLQLGLHTCSKPHLHHTETTTETNYNSDNAQNIAAHVLQDNCS